MVRAKLEPCDLPQGRCRVAVIGLGMAGATAAHMLSKKHDVVAIEALPEAGLHYHSIVDGDNSFDVPLRAISSHYYPNLCNMYRMLGVELQQVNYESTGSDAATHDPYFHYSNTLVGGLALPRPSSSKGSSLWVTLRIVIGYLWLVFEGAYALATDRRGARRQESIGAFLKRRGYSAAFVERFFLPAMSTLLSCSYEQTLGYPADLILDFFSARCTTLITGWFRLRHGVRAVSARLLSGVTCRYGCRVERIERHGVSRRGGDVCGAEKSFVRVHFDKAMHSQYGKYEDFDYVVLATDAPVARKMLADPSADEAALMGSVEVFRAHIVAHTDESLMPNDPESWSGLNYFSSASDIEATRDGNLPQSPRDASMTTAFMSRFGMAQRLADDTPQGTPTKTAAADSPTSAGGKSGGTSPVFQTWNPYRAPREGSVIREAYMGRAVWTVSGREAFLDACDRGAQGSRRVWFAGSYACRGITLLEQACTSGLDVAQDFGVDLPFGVEHDSYYSWPFVIVGAVLAFLTDVWLLLQRLLHPPRM